MIGVWQTGTNWLMKFENVCLHSKSNGKLLCYEPSNGYKTPSDHLLQSYFSKKIQVFRLVLYVLVNYLIETWASFGVL